MNTIQKTDSVLWLAHLRGDEGLREELTALPQHAFVRLRIAGSAGVWSKMRNAAGAPTGTPTPGLRAADAAARDTWREIPVGSIVALERDSDAPQGEAVPGPLSRRRPPLAVAPLRVRGTA